MKRKIKKFFIKNIFVSTFLLSTLVVIMKFYIPDNYQFIEPISIYWTLLSSIIFIYWFILAPAITEYKESERLLIEIKNSLINVSEDAIYLKWLKNEYDLDNFNKILAKWLNNFYYSIADDKKNEYISIFEELNKINLEWEKLWITANHIIRMKQELSNIKKSFLRITEIKSKDALPKSIHQLKNFLTFMVIITLLFLKISKTWSDLLMNMKESTMLFLISFLYFYLFFIINWFENPFDKRKFNWFLDLQFIKDFAKELK